jgi:putative phage-type endonuclease
MEKTFIEIEDDTLDPEFRRNHVGGSDIGIILGVSPYKTPYMLWLEKTGKVKPQERNDAMLRGQALESTARDCYIENTGISVTPKNFKYKPWEVLTSSLDGISMDFKVIYEAKCPTNPILYLQAYEDKFIPEFYFAQCQTYLMVMSADVCDYHVYMNNNEHCIINIYPDKKYQENILIKAKEFSNMVTTRTPPKRVDGDPFLNELNDARNIALELKEIKLKRKEYEEKEEKLEDKLKPYMNGEKHVIFSDSGIYGKEVERNGSVEWTKLAEDLNISKETQNIYRKENTKYIQFK